MRPFPFRRASCDPLSAQLSLSAGYFPVPSAVCNLVMRTLTAKLTCGGALVRPNDLALIGGGSAQDRLLLDDLAAVYSYDRPGLQMNFNTVRVLLGFALPRVEG